MAATQPVAADQGYVPTWTVGDRLRKAREAAGIGGGQMADRLGVNPSTVSRWERATSAQMMVIRLYSIETGVPAHWIEHGTADIPTTPRPQSASRGRRGSTVWYPPNVLQFARAA